MPRDTFVSAAALPIARADHEVQNWLKAGSLNCGRENSMLLEQYDDRQQWSLIQPNNSAFQKHELNNSLLQGPQERVNVKKTGQLLITLDGSELLGDEYYLMAHGKNSKPLKTKCEKRHLAPASGRCSLPRCRRQVQNTKRM